MYIGHMLPQLLANFHAIVLAFDLSVLPVGLHDPGNKHAQRFAASGHRREQADLVAFLQRGV